MIFYILLACLVKGFATVEDDFSNHNCFHLYPEELETFVIPDADSLTSMCPKLIGYLECEQKLLLEENSDIHPILNGTIDLAKGICDDDSNLHKDYLASVECFRNFEHDFPTCDEAAQRIYLGYRHFITRFGTEYREDSAEEHYYEEEDKEDSVTYEEPFCMMTAYAVGCLGTKILDTCGKTAQETFVEIVQGSKILTQYCPEQEGNKLRSEFLDYLAFEKNHPQIGLFRDVFDFKRKK